jgi:hypothetical protein
MTTFVLTLPDQQENATPLHVSFHLITTLNVTADEARQKVNREVIPELGTGLIAQTPELRVIEEQVTWRVPIILSLPGLGNIGQVGVIEVDAHTGEVLTDTDVETEIVQHARWLYNGATLPN